MSVLAETFIPQSAETNEVAEPKTQLRAVPYKPHTISSVPFVLLIVCLLGLGMGGVVFCTNIIQSQSLQLSELQQQESELHYKEAALSAQVLDMRSSQQLAKRAWEIGMRPNPNPVFIEMPSGRIIGNQVPVAGNELPGITPRG